MSTIYVSLTIREYENGGLVNECKLEMKHGGDYLETVRRRAGCAAG